MKLILPLFIMAILFMPTTLRAGFICQELLLKGEMAFFPEDVLPPAKIKYDVYGQYEPGKKVIVLLHGLGGSKRTWEAIGKELSKDFYVIAPDSRGHGLTEYNGDYFSTSMMAADLRGLLRQLNVSKVSLVGHSMGGRTAARFAERYPEMVEKLMIEDMHMKGRSKLLPNQLDLARELRAIPKHYDNVQHAVNSLRKFFGEDYIRKTIIGKFSQPAPGGGIDITYNFNSEAAYRLYENQGLQEELGQVISQTQAPSLFMAANPDKGAVLFGMGLEHLQKSKPDARVVLFEDAGHSIHHDSQARFVATVSGFVRE